jgi:hypothetical protein
MNIFTRLLPVIFAGLCFSLHGQISSYEEIEFEQDSMKAAYKPATRNFVFMKSKKGSGGLPKSDKADAILNTPITEIVLVFTEMNSSAIEEREDGNRQRWENLFETYPEFFQYTSTFKNVCQCNSRGDSAAFKQAQGFYVFYEGDAPAAEPEPVAPAPVKKEEPKVAKVEPKVVKEEPKTPEPVKTKAEPKAKEPEAIPEPAKVKEKVVEKEKEAEPEPQADPEPEKEKPVATTKTPKNQKLAPTKKRPGYEKPRRARDAKACRQPCYGYGDEDLIGYFKTSIILTKKQKKKGKNILVQVRIQLNYDGSIKKAFVVGENEVLNQQVQGAIDQMGYWNPAVKAGVTVKSEVKFNLKYDKPSKSVKPMDIVINPRPGQKCPCVTDSEMFGD